MTSVEIRDSAIAKVNVGDELYTSGEGGVFSSSIPVAKVSSIDARSGKLLAVPVSSMDNLGYAWTLLPVVTSPE
jgi:cell shape-determining protein MreC